MANKLQRAEQELLHGGIGDIIERVATKLLAWLKDAYKTLSKFGSVAGITWERIKWQTLVLSRGRKFPQPKTWAQASNAANRAKALIDTGATLNTLNRGNAFNIFEVGPMGGAIGSNSPILAAHQDERIVAFNFGSEEEGRLQKNVGASTYSRAQQTVAGKRPVSAWNQIYFQMRAALRSQSGQSKVVPARPLPKEVPSNIVKMLQSLVSTRLINKLKGAHKV